MSEDKSSKSQAWGKTVSRGKTFEPYRAIDDKPSSSSITGSVNTSHSVSYGLAKHAGGSETVKSSSKSEGQSRSEGRNRTVTETRGETRTE